MRNIFSLNKIAKGKIPGGLSEGKEPGDFDQEELRKGIEVEKEHTVSEEIAKEIAMDHLTEDTEYYTKLKKCKL